MYSHIMMDLDGTIYNFAYAQKRAFFETFKEFGICVDEKDYLIYEEINSSMWRRFELGTINREDLVTLRFEKLLKRLRIDIDPVRINKRYLSLITDNTKIFEGVYDVLSKLSLKYTLCAITNGTAETQWAKLVKTDTKRFFDKIFISQEMGVQKPQKRFFDIVTDYYSSVPKENFLVVGDSLTADIKGAFNSSLDCVWINSDNVTSGDLTPKFTISNICGILSFL